MLTTLLSRLLPKNYDLNVDGMTVNKRIAADDGMLLPDWPDQYFECGADALRNVLLAMQRARKTELTSILDLPCGHGRVLRWLRARFPLARISACDLDRSGVDYCASTFGAIPVYSEKDLRRVRLETKFDLIWVGSLFTHLPAADWGSFLGYLADRLVPDGVLIFTTCGRFVERIMADKINAYQLKDSDIASILTDHAASGFGYANYAGQEYGIALSSPEWVFGEIRKAGLRLISFTEFGWGAHQDVAICTKLTSFPASPWDAKRWTAMV